MPQNKKLDIGKVLSQALETMSANLAIFLAIALPFTGTTAFMAAWMQQDYVSGRAGMELLEVFQSRDFLTRMVILWGIGAIIGAVVHAALSRATVTRLSGGTPTLIDSLETGFTALLPVALITLLISIGVGLGLVLFIVPGIILWLGWCVAIPACVMERLGPIEALKRSFALTEGERGNLFLLGLVVSIGLWIFGMVVGLVAGFLGGSQVVLALTQGLNGSVSAMANTAVLATAYFELRALKEGGAPNELENVFS